MTMGDSIKGRPTAFLRELEILIASVAILRMKQGGRLEELTLTARPSTCGTSRAGKGAAA